MKITTIKDQIARRVIEFYAEEEPAWEQIVHTQAVASYTRLIACGEGKNEHETDLQEIAAWLHDIGCPSARKIYGNSLPVHQQAEGKKLTAEWLADTEGLTAEEKQWLADSVGSHHQFPHAKELHFEPLFEADLIVNLIEGYYSLDKAQHFYDTMITTATGKALFESVILKRLQA